MSFGYVGFKKHLDERTCKFEDVAKYWVPLDFKDIKVGDIIRHTGNAELISLIVRKITSDGLLGDQFKADTMRELSGVAQLCQEALEVQKMNKKNQMEYQKQQQEQQQQQTMS